MKLKLYKDPATEIGEFRFSDLFIEGGPEPESDFRVLVYRTGHARAQGNMLAKVRQGVDFSKAQKMLTEFTEISELDDPEEVTKRAATVLADEDALRMIETVGSLNQDGVVRLVADIEGLPIEEDGEVKKINLSDYPNEFEDTVRQLGKEHPAFFVKIREVAIAKEDEFQSYLATAKNASSPGSTEKPGDPLSSNETSTLLADASISGSDVQ